MTVQAALTYIDRAKRIVEARTRLEYQLLLTNGHCEKSATLTVSLRDAVVAALQYQGRSRFALTILDLLPVSRAPDNHELSVIRELESALFAQMENLEDHITEAMFSTRT